MLVSADVSVGNGKTLPVCSLTRIAVTIRYLSSDFDLRDSFSFSIYGAVVVLLYRTCNLLVSSAFARAIAELPREHSTLRNNRQQLPARLCIFLEQHHCRYTTQCCVQPDFCRLPCAARPSPSIACNPRLSLPKRSKPRQQRATLM
jgi:hypothetical protein